jgi:cell division protein FtsI (penicillin-binding protein 3)
MDKAPFRPSAKSVERLCITGLILLGWALIAVLRLVDLQVFAHHKYVRAAEVQQDKRKIIEPVRGAILDRNGAYLAISSPSLLAVVNPLRITNVAAAAGLLGAILETDAHKLQQDLEAAVSSNHPGYFVVDSHLTEEKASEIRDLNLDWIDIRPGSVRSYPNHQRAAHVVGTVGGDGRGAAGVEAKFNQELAGKPGYLLAKVDVRGHAFDSEIATTPVPGKTIALTIDSAVQQTAEEALERAVIQNHAIQGSVVAMDPNTGEVLALANYPTYDLEEHLHAGEKQHGRENLAVGSPFEPGSVFKVVTISAALETTKLTPMSLFDCGNGSFPQYGRVIHDAERHGTLTLADVLAKSSNIGAVKIGMVVGMANMYEYVHRLGFGQKTGIELPAEARGMVRPFKHWTLNSMGSVPMGHEVSVTSLQLAQLGSVIANGGFLVHPHIVNWEQAPGGPRENRRLPRPVQVLKPETVMTMRALMRRVVQPGGTASHLHVIGYSLAGKTGTAQIFDFAHHVYTHKYNASFMGMAPSTNPRMVVVVTLSGTTGEAGFGASAAGPVFESVMSTALLRLNIARDVPEEVETLLAKDSSDSTAKEGDDTSLASVDPPTEEEMKNATADVDSDTSEAEADPNAPKAPNLVGKTVKDVMQEAAANGWAVELYGSGLSRTQSPAPGALLVPGQPIQVRFAH